MKKVLKVIGIILLSIFGLFVLLIVGIIVLYKISEYNNDHYYENATTGGAIEEKYSALGSYDVSFVEFDSNIEDYGNYAIWYPSELDNENCKYPVILWANGTGLTSDTYEPFLKHLASWGFIVVGNDDENTRTGASLEEGIKFLITANSTEDNMFFNKIDLDRIGIGGQSQGGPAVFNMVTNQEHGYMVKALYAASPTSSYHTVILEDSGEGWIYDISKISIPVFLTAGTGIWDAGTATYKEQVNDDENGIAQGICPTWSLNENYDLLPNNIDKVIARRIDSDHGNLYLNADGYMTAWFLWQLKEDSEASKAFTGDSPELLNNELYSDQKINLGD